MAGSTSADKEPKPTAEEAAAAKLTKEQQKAADAADEEGGQVFELGRLRYDGAAILSTPSKPVTLHEIAGAFTGVPDSNEITVKDARARIKQWLSAEVEQSERDPNIA